MKQRPPISLRSLLSLALAVALSLAPVPLDAQELDVLIRNARVNDGTGNPGFIDLHSHADRSPVADSIEPRQAHNLVAQGITTVVGGPDGRNAMWPVADEMAALRGLGIAVNFVPMVGHSTVRGMVMGDDYEREATAAEIDRMKALVRQGMEAGAWGLGAGLAYRPAHFSTTEELIALAGVVTDYDGFYFAHQRRQSPLPKWQVPSMVDSKPLTGTDGLKETIRIGRETGIRVVGTHIKTKGMDMWGHAANKDVIRIERARAQGVQVYLDQYPYETFGGGLQTVIPPWAFAESGTDYSGGLDDPKWDREGIFENFRQNLRANLDDPEFGPILVRDMEYLIRLKGGADRLIIVDTPLGSDLVGQTLAEVAERRGVTPVQMLVEFAMEGGTQDDPHGVLFRPVASHAFDVEVYMKQPYTATSTDAGVSFGSSPGQHPRYYGAMVRKIAHYAKETGTISLPFAVRAQTSLPARIISLPRRGLVREGYFADLVIFDYERLDDRARIMEPYRYPEGIEYVIVNGRFTVDRGRLTGALPGRVLDRNEVLSGAGADAATAAP